MRSVARREQDWIVRYAVLTVAIAAPLLWAFATVTNLYPIPVWSLFSEAVDLSEARSYYMLRGETMEGEIIDIPAIEVTRALNGRNHMLVYYAVDNHSLKIRSPHPSNVDKLNPPIPSGALVEDLLRGWGSAYNARWASDSPHRLRSMRLDGYLWSGGDYNRFAEPGRSWKVEL